MYKNGEKSYNIILFFTDAICLYISYYLSGYIWLYRYKKLSLDIINFKLYSSMSGIIIAFIIAMIFLGSNRYFLERGKLEELKAVIKENLVLGAAIAVIAVITKDTSEMSRGVYVLTVVINICFMYISHLVIKMYLLKVRKKNSKTSQMFLITTKDRALDVISKMNRTAQWNNRITSMAVIDDDMVGTDIANIPVTATYSTMIEYVKRQVVDEVFINIPYYDGVAGNDIMTEAAMTDENDRLITNSSLRDVIMEFENMGVVVHLNIPVLEQLEDFEKGLGRLGNIPVVTFAHGCNDPKKLLIKRVIDIVGGVIGICITAIVTVFLAPVLLLESSGPLIFKQKRVGKNGRFFNIYKFRSMHVDAEERKKELMEKNEMNGLMFKMTDDPRITKVGKFIRKTSIDELPQFFNVLKGDMSLVGTRPPTVDEFNKYESYHKRRLSAKPGITGLWQVSGRSNIDNFEDVVKLDLEYIDNWSLTLDLKIIFKTVGVVFKRGGAK